MSIWVSIRVDVRDDDGSGIRGTETTTAQPRRQPNQGPPTSVLEAQLRIGTTYSP